MIGFGGLTLPTFQEVLKRSMTELLAQLPPPLLARIVPGSLDEQDRGRLRNQLLRVTDREAGPAWLKIGTGLAATDLREEADRLQWIGDRLPVPQVLHREEAGGTVFLLLSELSGMPLHKALETLDPEAVVERFADALRRVHAIPTEGCPFDDVLERELAESERRLQDGGLDEDAFTAAAGAPPAEVLADLRDRRSILRDLVFTHGDYCLPNVLVQDGDLSGILDWGIAGVADRHRDFMSIELTLRRNCGEVWIPRFYDRYGQDAVDTERVRYYWRLDQFFSHYEPPA